MNLSRLLLVLSLPLYVVDQITKWWIVMNFSQPAPGYNYAAGESIVVIEGFFNIVRVHNQGVAFGFGNGTSWAPIVFLAVPIIAMGLLWFFYKKGAFATNMLKFAAALLVTGILGNLTDRLFQGFFLDRYADASFWTRLSQGYVVDFIDVILPLYDKIVPKSGGHWPAFNVADSCISIAAILLIISTFQEDVVSKEESSEP